MKLQTCFPAAVAATFLILSIGPVEAGVQALFDGPSVASSPTASSLSAQLPIQQSGEVVITEFMKDPSSVTDTKGEWIELYNNLPWRVNIEGWTLSDDSGAQHIIWKDGNGIRVAPGQYFVLGNNADSATNGGVVLDYAYTGFVLGNGADQIVLSQWDGFVVDRVDYDDGVTWPDSPGMSIGLELAARDALQNDLGTNWCSSSTPLSATNPDTGTPHVDNDPCP